MRRPRPRPVASLLRVTVVRFGGHRWVGVVSVVEKYHRRVVVNNPELYDYKFKRLRAVLSISRLDGCVRVCRDSPLSG